MCLRILHFLTFRTAAEMDNAETIRNRMISDLLASERTLKESALQVIQDFRAVMFYVARQVDGWRVQDLQRVDPNFFQNWTPVQWRAFFEQSLNDPAAWRVNRNRTDEEHKLALENQALQKELNTRLQNIEDLRDEIAYLRNRKIAAPRSQPETIVAAARADVPAFYNSILAQMQKWTPPTIPARFKQMVSNEDVRWRRQSMALAIMANHGISTRIELDQLVGTLEEMKARSGSLRSALDMLTEKELVRSDVFSVHIGVLQSALTVIKLSDGGKELCSILGWNPVESDWERIDRLHQGEQSRDHTFGLLAFAMHARLRGWKADVLPEIQPDGDPWQPDVLLQHGSERCYVEVEMSDKENAAKWKQQARLQPYTAFCTATNQQRAALVSDCKRLKLPGMGTSLETLVGERVQDIHVESPLWAETWETG